MPLKGVSPIISPDLLRALALMGHGDKILLADCHFPATSIAARSGTNPILIRADGHGIPELLKAILQLIELDTYDPFPVTLMQRVPDDVARNLQVPVWDTYKDILKNNLKPNQNFQYIERYNFYDMSKHAFVIVQTGETAQYGNIMLTNGLVLP